MFSAFYLIVIKGSLVIFCNVVHNGISQLESLETITFLLYLLSIDYPIRNLCCWYLSMDSLVSYKHKFAYSLYRATFNPFKELHLRFRYE